MSAISQVLQTDTPSRKSTTPLNKSVSSTIDWARISYLVLVSRTIDLIEETRLVPEKKVLYQFSARGHELNQILLGCLLNHPHDAISCYYRSRPLILSLGLTIEDAFAGPLGKSGGFSDGRDIGVVGNLPSINHGPTVLPMSGGVGTQYTPTTGWAQAILYRRDVLGDKSYKNAIAVAAGGDGSVATNGFWSAITIATTLHLPVLFCIEDNGFGLSVPAEKQTPGGNISKNLASFENLHTLDGDGSDPVEAFSKLQEAINYVRTGMGPLLLHLKVPRLCGHSGQDTQAYKSKAFIEDEKARDPIYRLHKYLVPNIFPENKWKEITQKAEKDVEEALQRVLARPDPDPARATRYVFAEKNKDGTPELQKAGGLLVEGHVFPSSSDVPQPEPVRITMLAAIRRTLEVELKTNPKLLVFGEDIAVKGGVHTATLGLHEMFGEARVFDTSLSEEGITGRAVGMALAGLMPVAEIQFRKYTDSGIEHLHDCGTIRWRTANRFAAPIVVRTAGGFSKCGDPWHSVCDEVHWAHATGWQCAYPSNAEDAVGLLRAAMRSNNPTYFFEHRALLDLPWARRPYPGDHYVLPFGKAKVTQEGSDLTIVSWGAMVERCELASKETNISAEVIDLRTISPWDKEMVINSVKKTHKCLIVHEDGITAGFGAEVSATLAKEAFFSLDAPIERLAVPDIPNPYNLGSLNFVLPTVSTIAQKIRQLVET